MWASLRFAHVHAPEAQHEHASLPWLGPRPNLALMSLNDLIHDRQTETGASFKLRLKGLEDLFNHLGTHPGTSVSKADLPVPCRRFERDAQRPCVFHRPHCVLRKIPEDLFELV